MTAPAERCGGTASRWRGGATRRAQTMRTLPSGPTPSPLSHVRAASFGRSGELRTWRPFFVTPVVCASARPYAFAMPAYWSVSGDPCPASGGCRPHSRAQLRLLFSPLLIICVTRRAARRASQSHLRSCGPTGRAAMWARRRGSTRSRHTPRPRSTTAPRGSPAR